MLNQEIVDKLKQRYKNIHPLIFHRTLEHAKSEVELFDILHDFPNKYPVFWDEELLCWVKAKSLF